MASPLIDQFRLPGQVAVVTGGGSGIGKCTAELFAAAGARVVVVDINPAAAESVAGVIVASGGSAWARQTDISDEAAVQSLFADVAAREGRIDILVNSAGAVIRRPAVELTLADWDKVVAVNMTGVFLCCRTVAQYMQKDERGGAIVNIASIMGLSGGGLYPNISYQSSKGAVVNMTRALAVEWAKQKIRVNAVAPTYVRTPFIAALLDNPELVAKIEDMTPMGRLAVPEDIATAVLFLASPAAAMITGQILAVDGGFLAQ
jgi:2-deoxy-D-gluconate 3-dehydrogenase